MEIGEVVAQLDEARAVLAQHPTDADALRQLQRTIDVLETAKAEAAHAMAAAETFKDDGSSSMKTWLRTELRLDSVDAHRLLAAGRTLRQVPTGVRDAARTGEIRPGHVAWFGYALTHVGPDVVGEPVITRLLADTARAAEPAQLKAVVRELRDQIFPEALDEAWIRGMDKQDLNLSRLGDHGWAITGFLPIGLGAQLHAVLRSLSAPRDADDTRTASQRRLDGLETLLTGVLEHGLPQDRGVRPHLDVLVDHDELRKVATDDASLSAPAQLAGFGSIGRAFLSELLCGANLTPILTGGKDGILDVGRTHRVATPRQRRAVTARQGGQCAAPGCTHPVVHLHHVVWFSHGGRSDLSNYIGLCPGCHRLVHADRLHIDPRTHAFTRPYRAPVRSNPSSSWLSRRRARDRLRRALPHLVTPPRSTVPAWLEALPAG